MSQVQTKMKAFDWRSLPDPEEWRASQIEAIQAVLEDYDRLFEHHNARKAIERLETASAGDIVTHVQALSEARTEERWDRWRAIAQGTRYVDCTLSNYEVTCDKQRAAVDTVTAFRNALPHHLDNGTNLLLYGSCGTGKDHLMAALLKTVVLDLRHSPNVSWTTGVRIAATAKQDLGTKQHYPPSVLAISDPVCSGETAMYYAQQRLHELIDTQYSNNRSLWLTVNCTGRKQLDEMLGPQLADRVCENAVLVPCFWESRRKPLADQPRCEVPMGLISEVGR